MARLGLLSGPGCREATSFGRTVLTLATSANHQNEADRVVMFLPTRDIGSRSIIVLTNRSCKAIAARRDRDEIVKPHDPLGCKQSCSLGGLIRDCIATARFWTSVLCPSDFAVRWSRSIPLDPGAEGVMPSCGSGSLERQPYRYLRERSRFAHLAMIPRRHAPVAFLARLGMAEQLCRATHPP